MKDTGSDSKASDSLDAVLWALLPALTLSIVGIGALSGDAVMHAARFTSDTWSVNPNHLLMEPIAAAWFDFAQQVGLGGTGPDRLKYLNIWSGGLSLGVFRWGVLPLLTDSRIRRNVATAFFGGGFGFLALWVSGEPHMMQMPFLVLASWAAVRYLEQPEVHRAVMTGAAFGIAALFLISNVVPAAMTLGALALWRSVTSSAVKGTREGAAGMMMMTVVVLTGALIFWLVAKPDVGFLSWMLEYSGRESSGVVDLIYGIDVLDPVVIATAFARSLYGAALAFVNVAPTVDALRGMRPILSSPVVSLAPVVLALAAGTIVYSVVKVAEASDLNSSGYLVVIVAWVVGVGLFGMYFNVSDDQFYFQLAVPIAMAVAMAPIRSGTGRSYFSALVILVVLWNVSYVGVTKIGYPREARLQELKEETARAGLVVHPGNDEVGRLLSLLPDSVYRQRLTIVKIAGKHAPEKGLRLLADSLETVRAAGEDIRIIDIYNAHPQAHPWSFLQDLGYGQRRVQKVLEQYQAERLGDEGGAFDTWLISPDSARSKQ